MSKAICAVVLSTVLLAAAPAFAIDGQVLISQATVMAAGGFPYKITQPGSYKLSGNLVVPANTDGVDITANNVTLDLNGFGISGPQTCTGTGATLSCSGGSNASGFGVSSNNLNITVENGSISGMGSEGIALLGSGNRVEDVSTAYNGNIGGGVVGAGIAVENGVVRRCTANFNNPAGIFVINGVVESNVANYNEASGFTVHSSTAIGNTAVGNGLFGLGAVQSIYGSNSLIGNPTDAFDAGQSKSQNNNICTGGTTC